MTEIHFRRRGRAFSAAVAASALVLSGAAGCGDAGTAIARLTIGDPGPDPYARAKGTDRRLAAAGSGVRPPGGTRPGDAPGLYGGTRRRSHCDMKRLVTFLREHPDRAGAWASVQRIAPAAIDAFVARLTPVHLRSDTLVTNHGYRAGKATGAPAVLEAGMGVLINEYGVPVVKCNCGNPLTPPDPKLSLQGSRYTGPSWPDFHAGKVTRIQPGRAPAQGFVLSDPNGRGSFSRPRGTEGAQDGPRVPEPPVGDVSPRATSTPRGSFSAESHFSKQSGPTQGSPPFQTTSGLPSGGTSSGGNQQAPSNPGGTPEGPPPGHPPNNPPGRPPGNPPGHPPNGTASDDPTGSGSHRPAGGQTAPPDTSHDPQGDTSPGRPGRTGPERPPSRPEPAPAHPAAPSGNTDPGERKRL